MDPNREINDEQLDALLRDVEVPADLKDQLRTVPSQCQTIDAPQTGWNLSLNVRWLAIAATLLAVAGFLTWVWLAGNDTNDQPIAEGKRGKNSIADATNETEEKKGSEPRGRQPELIPDDASRLADDNEIEPSIADKLETLAAELELRKLRSRLASLEAQSTEYLSANEYESIVQALANQSSLELGGDESRIRREMLGVMTAYPDTRGAEYARQYVDNSVRN